MIRNQALRLRAILRLLARHQHPWAGLLSIAAVVISGASWYEAYQSRKLNTIASQAVLQTTSATIGVPAALPDELTISLTINNFGNSTASRIKFRLKVRRALGISPATTQQGFDDRDEDTTSGTAYDIAPKASRVAVLPGPWLTTALETYLSGQNRLFVYGRLYYIDEATGKARQDHWCFVWPPQTPGAARHEMSSCPNRSYSRP